MTIILFIVDTSVSMNQRTYYGMALLDIASKAINDFVQQRKRDPHSRGDRYMLMTFEENPFNLKAGWKENQETFDSSLKCMMANQLNDANSALQNAFTILNVNKLQAGKEAYGTGRYPSLLDPTVVILISDGVSFQKPPQQQSDALLTNVNNNLRTSQQSSALFRDSGAVPIHHTLANIKLDIPGGSMTNAPYRWDQRLFSWILRFPGRQSAVTPNTTVNTSSNNNSFVQAGGSAAVLVNVGRDKMSLLDLYAVETGGRSYLIDNFAALQSAIASTCQKVVPGVVVEFQAADKIVIEQITRAAAVAAAAAMVLPATKQSPSVTKSPASGGESENNDIFSRRTVQSSVPAEESATTRTDVLDAAAASEAATAAEDAVVVELKDGLKQMLIVKRESANKTPLIQAMWPIPEQFAPEDGYQQKLPPRPVHPQFEFHFDSDKTIRVPQSTLNGSVASFAVDRFDLEPSPFTELCLKITTLYRDCSWPISINLRSKTPPGRPNVNIIPCGYLKASSPSVMSLYLLPAHYEKLFKILENFNAAQKPTALVRDDFLAYVNIIPFYVRDALVKYGFRGFDSSQLLQLLQDSVHTLPPTGLSHVLTMLLRKDKQDAKRMHDEFVARGVVQRTHDATVPIMPRNAGTFESQTQDVWHIWKNIIEVRGMQQGFEQLERMRLAIQDLLKRQAIRIAARRPISFMSMPDNPFDVERDHILLGLRKSRRALMDGPGKQTWFAESADDVDDVRHSMPSSVMSNFMEFKKTLPLMPELRTLDVGGERSTQSFGNPFKSKQAQRDSAANAAALGALVDEMVDIDLMPSSSSGGAAGLAGGASTAHSGITGAFKMHHLKSKKSSVLSRTGSRGGGKHRSGGGGGSEIISNSGSSNGAFGSRPRGPLPRNFVWLSAGRRKRSASEAGFGGPYSPAPPLSPAVSLPDLSASDILLFDDEKLSNRQLSDGNVGSFSAPSSPMYSGSMHLSSPGIDMAADDIAGTTFIDDKNQKSLDEIIGGSFPFSLANNNTGDSVQASYAALVHHQDSLRMQREKLNSHTSAGSLPVLLPVPSVSQSLPLPSSTHSISETTIARAAELVQGLVLQRTRGEYEFRRSSWYYGITVLDAKQKLRQLVRNASCHYVQQMAACDDVGSEKLSSVSLSPSFSSATTSESEALPIVKVLCQFVSDPEVHLQLIVDCFNEALRFGLLSLAHHVYDYMLQNYTPPTPPTPPVNAASRSGHTFSAANACLLQHYVPKPHAKFLEMFRSRTAHLLPPPERDNMVNLSRNRPIELSLEACKTLKLAFGIAGSTSKINDELSSSSSLAKLFNDCIGEHAQPGDDASQTNIRTITSTVFEHADNFSLNRHAAAKSDADVRRQRFEPTAQQRSSFVDKLHAAKAARTSLSPSHVGTSTTNTTPIDATSQLRAMYERASQREKLYAASGASTRSMHAPALQAQHVLSKASSSSAPTDKIAGFSQLSRLHNDNTPSTLTTTTAANGGIGSLAKNLALFSTTTSPKSSAPPAGSSNQITNSSIGNATAPAYVRHASLIDEQEQKKIALKKRFQNDMLRTLPGSLGDGSRTDSTHAPHRARASTISTPADRANHHHKEGSSMENGIAEDASSSLHKQREQKSDNSRRGRELR